MTIQKQIEILQAYERGEEIEIKGDGGVWRTLASKYPTNYEFDFRDYDYRVKKKWSRARQEKIYFYLNQRFEIEGTVDKYFTIDNEQFISGNYFLTTKQAEKAGELLKECLIKFHEENDELY